MPQKKPISENRRQMLLLVHQGLLREAEVLVEVVERRDLNLQVLSNENSMTRARAAVEFLRLANRISRPLTDEKVDHHAVQSVMRARMEQAKNKIRQFQGERPLPLEIEVGA